MNYPEKKMKEFAALRAKTYTYLTNNKDQNKKAKGTKEYIIRREIKFEDHKKCLKATKLEKKTTTRKTKLMQKVFKKIIKNL